jgi:hypothetical protein
MAAVVPLADTTRNVLTTPRPEAQHSTKVRRQTKPLAMHERTRSSVGPGPGHGTVEKSTLRVFLAENGGRTSASASSSSAGARGPSPGNLLFFRILVLFKKN